MENTIKSRNSLIGDRIRECREEKHYTQEQLAQKVRNLPENGDKERSPQHLGCLERGERKLSPEWARLLSKALGVRAEYLLCEDDFKTEQIKKTYPMFKKVYDKQISRKALNKYFEAFGIIFEPWYSEKLNKRLSRIKGEPETVINNVVNLIDNSSSEDTELLSSNPCYLIKTKKGERIATISAAEYDRLTFETEDYIDYLFAKITEGR